MTLSGVFSAWARLPTWVRARSTTLAIGVEQQIDLGGERGDVLRKLAADPLGLAAPDRREPLLQHPQWAKSESHRQPHRAENAGEAARRMSPPAHIQNRAIAASISSELPATWMR